MPGFDDLDVLADAHVPGGHGVGRDVFDHAEDELDEVLVVVEGDLVLFEGDLDQHRDLLLNDGS